MEGKGLGRGLESIAHLAEEGPDLSGYVSTEVDELLSSKDSPRIAIIWMIIGSLSFGTMNAMVKFSSGLEGVDVWMVIMVRSSVIAFAVAAFAASRGISLKVNDSKTMLLRCSVGLFAMILYFSALARIPIGQAVTLQYSAPLFVALLSGRLIAEKVQPAVLALVITAFVGIILIVSPDLSTVEPNALLALGSGFFAALAYIFVRQLRKTDSATSVIFWFAAFSVAGTVVQAAPDLFTLDMRTVAALVGVG
ncbi:MAG: EamA family transporter, partial [Candidatus Poseidoniia archaeon]